jgi:hypothetical protein
MKDCFLFKSKKFRQDFRYSSSAKQHLIFLDFAKIFLTFCKTQRCFNDSFASLSEQG